MKNRKTPRLLAAAAAGLLLNACAIIDASTGDPRPRSQVGAHLHDIKAPMQVRMCAGRLVVLTDWRVPGIALVDTATDVVSDFKMLSDDVWPSDIACGSDESAYLALALRQNGGMSAGVLDIRTGAWMTSDSLSGLGGIPSLVASGGHVFVVSSPNSTIDTVLSGPLGITLKRGRAEPFRASSIAHTEHGTFVSSDTAYRHIYFRAAGTAGSYIPIQIASDTDYRITTLTAHGGNVFALATKNYDSSFVAVIDAESSLFVKWIPLSFGRARSGGVLNGKWYVLGSKGTMLSSEVPDGGIEIIDLETQTHAGVLATEAELGIWLADFTPTGERSGYAIFSPPGSTDRYLTRVGAQTP